MAMARSSSRINFRDAPNQRRRGWGWRLAHLLLGVLTFWLIGLLAFIAVIPGQASKIDSESKTDAIIVLTGGGDRLAEGFRLVDRGLSKRLLISGVAPGVTLPELIDRLGEQRDSVPSAEELACCVTLGYEAGNTVGNADESAEWLRSNGAKSVRLVTANYHMLRSLLEFRRKAPTISVVPNPVFPSEVRDPHWFVKPRTLLLLINEYHKYLVALARSLPELVQRWTSGWSFAWPSL
ncbi:YdcF family protein [Dongia sp. agr-C8]